MPAVIKSWFSETSLPLRIFGASSALYTGTIILNILHVHMRRKNNVFKYVDITCTCTHVMWGLTLRQSQQPFDTILGETGGK